MSAPSQPLLEVRRLTKRFTSGLFRRVTVGAVHDVSFTIGVGETLGIVGESGCGKTTLGRCIARLVAPTSGEIWFQGRNIEGYQGDSLRQFRRQLQVVFQDSDGTLNPRLRVATLLREPFRLHGLDPDVEAAAIEQLLEQCNLTHDLLTRFPHQLSGGQRQRIGIARAIALNPAFIVADEPAASLDLSVQAQILELLQRFQEERQISYLFISHNLRLVRLMSARIGVMYLGRLVEMASTAELLENPAHPYTRALLASVPRGSETSPRPVLAGEPPSPINPPPGCPFHTRCPLAEARCRNELPTLRLLTPNHSVACHLAA